MLTWHKLLWTLKSFPGPFHWLGPSQKLREWSWERGPYERCFFFSDYSSIAQQKNTMDRWHGIGCKKSNITLSINKIRILSVLCGRWCKCKPVRSQSFTQSVSGYNEQKTHCVDKYLKQTYSLTLLLCFWNSVQVTHYSRLFYLRSNNRETSVWL